MAHVTFVHPGGERETVEAEAGTSVMQAAMLNDVDGIVAECGGSLMCATCHVYVDEAFLGLVPERAEAEDEMLEAVESERRPSSRLSCQIPLRDELDGLVVHLPDRQV